MFSRRIEVGLSSAAIDLLFESAHVLSEGQVDGDRFYGSTMLTFDLSKAEAAISDDVSPKTLRQLSELAKADSRILDRAKRVGTGEARRTAGCSLSEPEVDIHVRAQGTHLHIDLDIEGTAGKRYV